MAVHLAIGKIIEQIKFYQFNIYLGVKLLWVWKPADLKNFFPLYKLSTAVKVDMQENHTSMVNDIWKIIK